MQTAERTYVIDTLQRATRALSGVCDGAHSLDGTGFNGVDTNFGKSLARQTRWSDKQAMAAQKMLRKYRVQLGALGIDISTLPTLEMDSTKPTTNRIDYNAATDALEFWFDYNFEQKEFIKTQLKAFFRKDDRGAYWNLRVARADLVTLTDYVNRYRPDISSGAERHLIAGHDIVPVANVAEQASAELSCADDADLSGYDMSGFMVEPFPFQRAGALYGLLKKKAIIGDDMGLGKTIQALLVAYLSGAADRMIVMCPASVKVNWQREIAKTMPHLTSDIWGGKAGRSDVNVIIINYDNIGKHKAKLLAFRAKMVVPDELHYLKSAKAARTQAALEICQAAEYCIGLTGTPILNRPSELIAPLTLLGRIDEFGGWYNFATRYCEAHYKEIWVRPKGRKAFQKKIFDTSGAANLSELNTKLRQICMVRRMKRDVLKDWPEKLRAQVVFPINNRADYDSAQNNLIAYVQATAAEDVAFRKMLALMNPVERAAAIEKQRKEIAETTAAAEQLVMIETLKQLAVKGKLDSVIEWINDFLDTGERLVLFATHIDVQEQLVKAFKGRCISILGEHSPVQRQAAVDKFRADESMRLAVCSLGAAGQGIDGLQDVCNTVAFLELGWTPAIMLQAEDRTDRIGQLKQVMCYYLIAENTVEETIQMLLAAKQAVCDSVLDGADEMRQHSIFDDLIDVLYGAPDKFGDLGLHA